MYYFKLVAPAFLIVFLTFFPILFYRYYSACTEPTVFYSDTNYVDGYIIDSVIDGNHFLAHLPNDDTVYTLTIRADSFPVWAVFGSYADIREYIVVDNIDEVPADQKGEM